MGRLRSLMITCASIDNLPYRLSEEEYKKREPELKAIFDALRQDITKGRYSTGNRMRDFCFLAAYPRFDLFPNGSEHMEYFEEMQNSAKKLRAHAGELVVIEDEQGPLYCGRISSPALIFDFKAMTAAINTGRRSFYEHNLYGWQLEKKNVTLLDVRKYEDFDIIDLIYDLDMALIGDEAVRERLGDEYNHVSDLLVPVPRQQMKMPI